MAQSVKIQDKSTGTVLEFPTLDNALRTLNGCDPSGDRFQQVLLITPSRRTFKEANSLIERNGYRIYREAQDVQKQLEKSIEKETKTTGAGVEMTFTIHDETTKEVTKMKEATKQQSGEQTAWELMAKQLQKFMETPQISANDIQGLRQELNEVKKEMNDAVKQALESHTREIVVKKAETGETKNVGRQHFQFETLLATIAARVNALLVGPAGSGKTSAAHSAAKALNIPFYSISVGMQTTKTEFFGYMDAAGKYVRTLFREAFEKGGVFLLDEMDAGNANVITSINQALANGYCAFPDGMVTKHPDFVIVASANTYGTGANREYVGRNQLDAATLDRFAVIEWMYDEQLEDALCANKQWLKFVRQCRKNAETHKIRTVVSPRASILGAQLLAQGLKETAVKDMLIFKGMNPTERQKLING